MTDQPNRRARKLATDLEAIRQELYSEEFAWKSYSDHPNVGLFFFARKGETKAIISVTCSPCQVSVAFWGTSKGYMFSTPTHDPLEVMTADKPICPEDWEQNMFSHSNNGPEQEGYYWDFENYATAVTELRKKWYANRDKFSDPITRNALQSAIYEADKIIGVAPSLPDVVSLNNIWRDKWHPLPELVPIDDYLLWDKQYLRALAVIHQLTTFVQNDKPEKS
ncbi:hypothetical protein [Pantoea sp. Ae16]|uniref:hypothetical protein n=1 Tax=Pantoea sp. Ae16 TaxID=1890373 RepID=UPI00091AFD72|nr:hypothetical protein [Pantoea sp. Ae16]OIX90506.1 hypothetical protein BFS13_09960 [Pantoea sp. Ae16]